MEERDCEEYGERSMTVLYQSVHAHLLDHQIQTCQPEIWVTVAIFPKNSRFLKKTVDFPRKQICETHQKRFFWILQGNMEQI